MRNQIITPLLILLVSIIYSCDQTPGNTNIARADTIKSLFELKSVEECGIDFNNMITVNDSFNYILVDAMIIGAGVGVVDINNDGLLDIFFSGNQVSDRLYLNKGNLQFEDITKSAGIENDTWSTAVAFADVNNDGWQDIYVGKFIYQDAKKRKNVLYINNGDNTFTNRAAEYGVDDDSHTSVVNFFDYDHDGDLDLYIGTEPFVHISKKHRHDFDYNPDDYTNRLLRNDGNKFTDVTIEAGLLKYNYCLAATVSDINHDGWPDMYVASDYEEADCYYINNRDGTFTDQIHQSMRHISNFSMGTDMADFNNDGWMDIMVADMAPEDNYRSKANMGGMNPERFWSLADNGYHYQYMFNTLQLNNGNGTFSEVGLMANVAKTDWSWATIFGDYDLDGDKDLFVTNGQLYDIRNKDFLNMVKKAAKTVGLDDGGHARVEKVVDLFNQAPQEPLVNYFFVNENNLTFTNQAANAGMEQKTFSQGAAYADLDNDGDLDLLVNNMNERSFLYENHSSELKNRHYLSFQLKGSNPANALAYGAKVWVFTGDEYQLLEVSPVRGYMSSSDPNPLFGLGDIETVDRVVVQWPNGTMTELKEVAANQRLILKEENGERKRPTLFPIKRPLFKDLTSQSNIDYVHKENDYDDYKDEILIPHRMSTLGPAAASADVNGDGLDDAFLGGGAGQSAMLYLQQANNRFIPAQSQIWTADAASEDVHAHFFDADNDGDVDLYVSSGSNEFPQGSPHLQDRLYINDGKGQFSKSNQLPQMRTSSGVAASGDIDGDGDLDLFIGGRQIPGKYGYPAQSYILRNDKGRFVEASELMDANLKELGMVTDAIWADFDGDKKQDLILAGEWMPLTVFINESGKLVDKTQEKGLSKTNGWWNKLAVADMDKDGDLDIVAGNLGLNIKFKASEEKPFAAYVKDFDENGTNDIYLAYYDLKGKEVPVRGRQCSSEQLPYILDEFKTYNAFAKATVEEVLGDRMNGAIKKEAYQFKSLYLENKGNASFTSYDLPNRAQSSPVNGIILKDWNNDGHLDILLAGNYYEREVETTRSDAGIGTVLLGNGKGNFDDIPPFETGMRAYFDVRNLLLLNNKSKPLVMVVNNSLGVQLYQHN